MRAFGPVPSRRLGCSLGVNNIPPKVCTYSCAYCQVGRTTEMRVERRTFYEPEEIVQDVRNKVEKAKEAGLYNVISKFVGEAARLAAESILELQEKEKASHK